MLSQLRTADTEHPPSLALSFALYKGRAWLPGPHPHPHERGLSPAHGPAGAGSLVPPGTPRSVCTTQHLYFLLKFKVSGLGLFSFFLFFFFFFKKKTSAVPWRDTQKARELRRQCNTLLTGQADPNSLWDSPPARLHRAGSEQGFRMISRLFLNQTHSSSCVANTLVFSC